MDPVVCQSCGARVAKCDLTEDEQNSLSDWHWYQESLEELRILLKVQAYFRRYPGAEERIKPHFIQVLESKDPAVVKRVRAGVPIDQIEVSVEPLPTKWTANEDDLEVVEYLQCHDLSLDSRLKCVAENLDGLKDTPVVRCRECNDGRLSVPPENWAAFDEFGASEPVSWYWPNFYSFDPDGALHVKASGWEGGAHWTGFYMIAPENPEYSFWRWMIEQQEFHRLVAESELPEIRAEWSRRTV